MSPKDRYENDVAYRQITDALESLITSAQLTPSEVRECAILACIHHEMRYGFTHYTVPLPINDALKKLGEWRAKAQARAGGAAGPASEGN